MGRCVGNRKVEMYSPDEKEIEFGRKAGELLVRIRKYLGGAGRLSVEVDADEPQFVFYWSIRIRGEKFYSRYVVQIMDFDVRDLDGLAQDIAGQWKHSAECAGL